MNFLYNLKRVVVLLCYFFLAGNASLTPLNFEEKDGADANKPYFLITSAKLKSLTSFYDLLGINEAAADSDIRKAYIKLSRLFHPDGKERRYPTFEERLEKKKKFVTQSFEEMFKKVSSAYETLSDATLKRTYDNKSLTEKKDLIKEEVKVLLRLAQEYEGFSSPREPNKPKPLPRVIPEAPKTSTPQARPSPTRVTPQAPQRPATPPRKTPQTPSVGKDQSEAQRKPSESRQKATTPLAPRNSTPQPRPAVRPTSQQKTGEPVEKTAIPRRTDRKPRAEKYKTPGADKSFLNSHPSRRTSSSSSALPRSSILTRPQLPGTKAQEKLCMKLSDTYHTVVRNGVIYPPATINGIPAKPNDFILDNENIALLPLTTDEQRALFYELLRIGFLPNEILPSGAKGIATLKPNLIAAGKKMNYFTYLPLINAACQSGSLTEMHDVSKNILRFFLEQRAQLLMTQNSCMRIDMREHRNLIRAINLLDDQDKH